MRDLMVVMAIAGLAGCAVVGDAKSNLPLLEMRSSKQPKEVAECVRDSWQNTTVADARVSGVLQASGASYSVLAPNAETPLHRLVVTPHEDGSWVSYQFYRIWEAPSSRVADAVKSCAE